MKGLAFKLLSIAFITNAIWEAAQTPLYRGADIFGMHIPSSLTDPRYLLVLLYATVGDVFYLALIYALVACIEHDICWIRSWRPRDTYVVMLAGLAFAAAIEWRGLIEGHWSYSALMPIVPVLHVGLSPLLQLPITALISFRMFRRYSARI